ncbi:MAG: hypothetical protein HUU14_11940 [Dehalococcoidia bacterium]|nr:hypothetical protein [Dehalococcoidia bacterium]NUQ56590.1 hypothetical protein [Dehalococcoidia bacterium]
MRSWRSVLLSAIALGAFAALSLAGVAAAADERTQYVASDSYYRLDPASGTLTVRVEATIQNATNKELPTVYFWAMPGAKNVVVTRGDSPLEARAAELHESYGSISVVTATLPKPMKPGAKFDFVMTYEMPALKNDTVRMEPGSIELPFLGQGEGSFVWVDVPRSAENYFDPGCLVASSQPDSVKSSGYERWICGEATIIALSADNPTVLKRCASADSSCRQRFNLSPYSAYVQSISDPALRGSKEAEVVLAGSTVKLAFRYFRRDEKWAEEQFSTALAALPLLRDLFGFDFPKKTLLMRQSHHIDLVGAAGVAFPSEGQVLLASDTGFDKEVTVHELAHQWAGDNLDAKWLWEGLAEYATRAVASQVGVAPIDRGWQSRGYKDPLSTWYHGSNVYDPMYWYGKAGAFWFAYEAAIGGREGMKAVLARMDDDPARLPLDARWFMDAGEYASGSNLDELFLTWVFNADTAQATIKERRTAHNLVSALAAREAQYGVKGFPKDLQANLDAWTFGGVSAQVEKVNTLLDAFDKVRAMAGQAGLPESVAVATAWQTGTIAELTSTIENQRQAVGAITGTAKELAGEPAGSPSLQRLEEARKAYIAGDFTETKRLASLAITTLTDKGTAEQLIALAKEKQAAFKPGLLARVGMLFEDPDGDLARAESAFEAGDPATALKASRAAYDGWNDASARGLKRLAIFTGLMGAFCVGVYYLLARIDRGPKRKSKTAGTVEGHYIPEGTPGRWRDWENMP